ncbi:MAG: hypothetical protein EBZ51_12110 [Synechococcaceae bacterium WB9_2_112]|nr:hypothetical protein [Synechococcaceae bacterium WB9_2_112]
MRRKTTGPTHGQGGAKSSRTGGPAADAAAGAGCRAGAEQRPGATAAAAGRRHPGRHRQACRGAGSCSSTGHHNHQRQPLHDDDRPGHSRCSAGADHSAGRTTQAAPAGAAADR